MSINITEYLGNLEQEKIAKRWDYLHRYKLLYVNDQFGKGTFLQTKNNVKKVFLPHSNQTVWVKRFVEQSQQLIDRNIANEILFSRIYNFLGVNGIESYPCFFMNPRVQEKSPSRKIVGICSKDIKSTDGLDVDILGNDYGIDFAKIFHKSLDGMIKNKQEFIDTELKTNPNAEELYNRLFVSYILDLILLLADNHLGNKFVIAKKDGGYEDIVSFDFEDNNINYDGYFNFKGGFENCVIPKGRFKGRNNCENLKERLRYIKELYIEGKLPYDCVVLFEKLQELNLDKLIRDTERETGYPITKVKHVDRIRKLVDYNQEFMAR